MEVKLGNKILRIERDYLSDNRQEQIDVLLGWIYRKLNCRIKPKLTIETIPKGYKIKKILGVKVLAQDFKEDKEDRIFK